MKTVLNAKCYIEDLQYLLVTVIIIKLEDIVLTSVVLV